MSASALDKVLNFAQPAPAEPDAADMVRAAAASLDKIALLLAKKADPDDDGDNDATAKGDTDHDFWTKGGKKKKPLPKKKSKSSSDDDEDEDDDDEDVAACRALVLEAMVALSQVQGGEVLSLSVLTQAEREKPSAHTISGSTDYPIPDKGHLAAAIARYKQGKYAGHKPEEIASHIRSRAKALGVQVDLAADPGSTVLALARGGMKGPEYPAPNKMVPMDHGPFHGSHSHPHRVGEVHDHEHYHNGDSRHACGVSNYSDY